ncbi:MAG: YIP1 family protein [Lachnospiraceae bacterium]|nr:YIP1 family protein [Lachnospiraceae bacterium]
MPRKEEGRIRRMGKSFVDEVFRFPGYVISSPFKAFSDIKYEKKGSMRACVFFMAALMVVTVARQGYTGFQFRTEDPQYINIWMVMAGVLMQTVLVVAANWSVSTLTNGSGSAKDIFMVCMYAQYPYIWMNILYILLSRVLSLNEAALANACLGLGIVCIVFYGFVGLVSIHGYGFFQGIASVILSVIAAVIIIFIILMIVMMGSEFIDFIRTVAKEITLHYL